MDDGRAAKRPGGFARRLLARALPGLADSRLAQDSLVVFWYSGLGRGVALLKELLDEYPMHPAAEVARKRGWAS